MSELQLGHLDVGLEGALNATLALLAFTEGANDPVHQGLIGIAANINTTRLLLAELVDQDQDQDQDGPCKHPLDAQRVTYAGKTKLTWCDRCNNVIAEGPA